MLLSIIIPTYNNFKNLSRCLKNLEKQTVFGLYKNEVEVVVVDDGSTHPIVIPAQPGIQKKSFWIPDQIGDDKKKLYLKLYQIDHSGASAARNFGFSKSSGEYVFFCDSDVVFLKNYALEKMIEKLKQNPDKAYCYSSFKYGLKTFKCGPFDAEKLKQNNYISTMAMIRRGAVNVVETPRRGVSTDTNKPFDPSLKRFQDWDLWLTLLEHKKTGIWIPEVLWQVKAGGTISHWLPKFFYKIFKNSKKVREYEKAKNIVRRKHNL